MKAKRIFRRAQRKGNQRAWKTKEGKIKAMERNMERKFLQQFCCLFLSLSLVVGTSACRRPGVTDSGTLAKLGGQPGSTREETLTRESEPAASLQDASAPPQDASAPLSTKPEGSVPLPTSPSAAVRETHRIEDDFEIKKPSPSGSEQADASTSLSDSKNQIHVEDRPYARAHYRTLQADPIEPYTEEMAKEYERPTDKDMKELRQLILDEMSSWKFPIEKVSVAYLDLTTGQGMMIRGANRVRAASAAKLILGMYICEMVHEGYFKWSDKVRIDKSVTGYDSYGPIALGPNLVSYDVSHLMWAMLSTSDNVATSSLANFWMQHSLTHDYEIDVNDQYGIRYDINHEVSPIEVLQILKRLYENKNGVFDPIIEDFSARNEINNLVTQGIVGYKSIHKTGYAYGNWNDFALIYTDYPYALVVMNKEVPETILPLTRRIGKLVFQWHVRRTQGYLPYWWDYEGENYGNLGDPETYDEDTDEDTNEDDADWGDEAQDAAAADWGDEAGDDSGEG